MTCYFCHKRLGITYYHIKTKDKDINICSHCNKALSKCKECDMPINTAREKAIRLCMNCRKNILICGICQKSIYGKYKKYSDMYVCDLCMRTAPRCDMCNCILEKYGYSIIQNKKLCPECVHNMDYCTRCHTPLFGQYYQVVGYREKFCKECIKKGNRCDLCSMPFNDTSHRLYKSQQICSTCRYTSIEEQKEAEFILKQVLIAIKKELNIEIPIPTNIHLVTYTDLYYLHQQYKPTETEDSLGVCIFVYQTNLLELYITNLLPYVFFMYILAQEYIYAWENKYLRSDTDLLYIDGMAQWGAYHVLLELGFETQADNISKQNDLCGDGFNEMTKLEQQYGVRGAWKKIEEKFAISIS